MREATKRAAPLPKCEHRIAEAALPLPGYYVGVVPACIEKKIFEGTNIFEEVAFMLACR